MKKAILLSIFFLLATNVRAQGINKIEYFIDTDAGFGQNTILTVNSEQNITTSIVASIAATVNPGHHKLYVRVRDTNGHWSHTTRTNIEIVEAETGNQIVGLEYFPESDQGFGNCDPIPITSTWTNGEMTFSVPLPAGNYDPQTDTIIFLRVKDARGNWSHTTYPMEIGDLGTATFKEQNIQVYPNPAADQLHVGMQDFSQTRIIIHDMNGRLLIDEQLQKEQPINVSALQSGVYTVRLWNAQHKIYTTKFIKK